MPRVTVWATTVTHRRRRQGRSWLACARVLFLAVALAGPSVASAPPGVETAIGGLVDSGVHPDLRWSRFPDCQDAARRAYDSVAFQPLWVRDGRPTPQAAVAITALSAAGAKGLAPADYDAGALGAMARRLSGTEGPSADEVAAFDVALTVSLMRFVVGVHSGKIDPRQVGYSLDVRPKQFDLWAFLPELARDPDPAARIAALDPPFPLYARLQETLTRYRELAARTDLPAIPELPKLRPGDEAAGLVAVRAWLRATGDLGGDATPPTQAAQYDPTLAAAVKRFQHRHGLEADGVIGPATLRALRVSPPQRVRQIELAMERVRWLPYAFPERFVVVNIPEFRLRGFTTANLGQQVEMGVVVGSSAEKTYTPVLSADMRYLVFRPYWLVPTSIARKELLPKAERDVGYLERQNMEVVDGRVRQRPGKNNALGLLKFIFPNPHHVYLHDTPSKALFQRSRRDFSHGCIRVADPPALAEFVLGPHSGWDRDRIRRAMTEGPDNRRVDLPVPVPVYVLYGTVVVDPDGTVHFFEDIYGHDARLDALLARGYPYP